MNFDRDAVRKWIDQYWTASHACQVCASSDWLLLDNVWELREFHGGGLVVGGSPVLPVVALMCNVCGHTVLFNAIAAKAIERPSTGKAQHE